MAKLPFVVEPRLAPIVELVGTDESGKFEIERRGYLNVSEKAFVQAVIAGDDSMAKLHTLAARISREGGVSQSQVYSDFGEEMPEYMKPFAEEIAEVMIKMVGYQEKQRMAAATALITSRIDSSWEISDTFGLHPDIIEGLNNLYEEEEKRCTDALLADRGKEDVDKVEEAEGKK